MRDNNIDQLGVKTKKQWGMSTKQGCETRFSFKILLHVPTHFSDMCSSDQYVNKEGVVVHGSLKTKDHRALSREEN